MLLEKISSSDLFFTNNIEDDRCNTFLELKDYDWMNYILTTKFHTKKYGTMDIVFEYFGARICTMTVKCTQLLYDTANILEVRFEYDVELFEKHLKKYMQKHMDSWRDDYAFYGEQLVVDFYNEVIEKGTVSKEIRTTSSIK